MHYGQTVLIVFALFMLLGGIMGAKAGSRASLKAGAGSAFFLFVTYIVSRQNPLAGYVAGTVIGLLLAGVFAKRLSATGKVMPSGMLLGVCIVAAGVLGFAAYSVA